jgi:antitoxin VapB
MSITIDDPETEALTTQLAKMTGLSVNDAVALAVGEAIARRPTAESPRQTAERLREQHGIAMSDTARTPLAREAFDEMWRRG